MAMGRGIRVYHTPGQNPYSILLEQRGQEQSLLLESQAIVPLSGNTWLDMFVNILNIILQVLWKLTV